MTQMPSMKEFSDTANASVESFQSLTNIVIDASEQLIALNVDATRAAVTYAWANTTSPFSARGFDDHHVQHRQGIEQANDYFRKMSALCAKTQSGLSEVNTRHASALKETILSMLESVATAGPAGTSEMVTAWKSALSNATLAYENLERIGRESAQANFALATSAAAKPSARKSA